MKLDEIRSFAAALGKAAGEMVRKDIEEQVLNDLPEGPEKDMWRARLYPSFTFCDHGRGICECGFFDRHCSHSKVG